MPSLPASRALWFVLLFVLQFLGCLGMVIFQEVAGNTTDTALETAIAVGVGVSYFVIIIIATSWIAVEGVAMLYDLYKREVERRAEERAERRTRATTRKESLLIHEEWEKLSPEEKSRQTYEEFSRSKWTESDEER